MGFREEDWKPLLTSKLNSPASPSMSGCDATFSLSLFPVESRSNAPGSSGLGIAYNFVGI
jgi:hypothetical protein